MTKTLLIVTLLLGANLLTVTQPAAAFGDLNMSPFGSGGGMPWGGNNGGSPWSGGGMPWGGNNGGSPWSGGGMPWGGNGFGPW